MLKECERGGQEATFCELKDEAADMQTRGGEELRENDTALHG